jgi:hypothetical protein
MGLSWAARGPWHIHIYIYINDVINEQFTGAVYCKSAGEEYALSGASGLVTLDPNDTVKIFMESDGNTTITTNHFPFVMVKI